MSVVADQMQDMLQKVGYVIIGSLVPYPRGHIANHVERYGDIVRQPFYIVSKATEKDIKRAAEATGLDFTPTPGYFYYKAITD